MEQESFRDPDPDLDQLVRFRMNTCVSIIVPTHPLSPERRADPVILRRALQQVRVYFHGPEPAAQAAELIGTLEELAGQVDFLHNRQGVGLFAAPGFRKLKSFFFPVREKVLVGDSFEVRDLMYQDYYSLPYLLVVLSRKDIRLFRGKLNMLEELHTDHFPIIFRDDFEYHKPSRGSSTTGEAVTQQVEKDKSRMQEIRLEEFFRQILPLLKPYLTGKQGFLVAGDPKDLAYFLMEKGIKEQVIGQLPGNFNHLGTGELGQLAWKQMRSWLDQGKDKLVQEFREQIGAGLGFTGIQEIWRLAREGRGLRLLVEKDFVVPGFLISADGPLYLTPPAVPHRILADAVRGLVYQILDHRGEVVFLEQGTLAEFQGMGLVARY